MAKDEVLKEAWEVLRMDHDGEMDKALAAAHTLAALHPESAIAHRLVGDLRYAAAIHVAAGDASEEYKAVDAALNMRVARDALMACKRLAPDCVDIAAALGDAFRVSKMFGPAESEFRRVEKISDPVDPAVNNAAYSVHGKLGDTTKDERVEEARQRARRSMRRMMVEDVFPLEIGKVLEFARLFGAAEGRKQAKSVADRFPDLARAQYLHAYMDLEFVRALNESINRRPFLRRTQAMAARAAQAFPNSVVIACFHAKLLFILGEYDAAEMECRRGLEMKDPDDPQHDCIPPGCISGVNCRARLVTLAGEFHEVIHKIEMLADDCWNSMSSERQQDFLSVRLDVLQKEYNKVDPSYAFSLLDVVSFMKEKGTWMFWVCPICDSKKFLDASSLLSHMCSKHPTVVLPRLQSVLDPKVTEKASNGDESQDGVSLRLDSEQKGIVSFDKKSDTFRWLFFAPSSGVVARPFPEIGEAKRKRGNMLLENIKDKMKTLPADKSTAEYAEALPGINDLWDNYLTTTVLDYRAMMVTLARSYLWKELKKCMTKKQRTDAEFITTVDIDAAFAKVDDKDDTDEALKTAEGRDGSEVQATESSETVANDKESSDPPTNMTESGNDLDKGMKNLQVDPVAEEDKESPDAPTKVTESGNELDKEMQNLQIDPVPQDLLITSEQEVAPVKNCLLAELIAAAKATKSHDASFADYALYGASYPMLIFNPCAGGTHASMTDLHAYYDMAAEVSGRSKQKQFPCLLCFEGSSSQHSSKQNFIKGKKGMDDHYNSIHSRFMLANRGKILTCSICFNKFVNRNELESHMRVHV